MRIGLFTELNREGGVDTFVISLINHWPNDDDFVLICNKSHPGLARYKEEINGKIEFIEHNLTTYNQLRKNINGQFLKKAFWKILTYLIRPFTFLKNVNKLKVILKNQEMERLLIVNGGYPAGDSCRAASISWKKINPEQLSVHTFHSTAVKTQKRFFLWDNIIDFQVKKSVKEFISVSKASAESLKENRFVFRKSKNISYIHNGLDIVIPDKSNTVDIREELGINLEIQLCIMIGTYEELKGHRFLFEAFQFVLKEYSNVQLLVCGTGSAKEVNRIKNDITRLEINSHIHLLGFRRDAISLIDQSDLVLIPSQSFESFGLTAVEAMACKKPVVSTDVGGLKEVVENGYGGYSVSRLDKEAFAFKILDLLDNTELREKQGLLGYERYNKMFKAERMAKQYCDLIK